MDKCNNNISILDKNEALNEKEKVKLPKIEKEMTPLQNKYRLNKLCQCEKNNNSKIKVSNPIFLTKRRIESGKINSYKLINNNKTNDKIFKLLKQKIEINFIKKNSYQYNTNKNLRSNKLKSYIDDSSLYRNSYYERNRKKKIKRINIGELFTISKIIKNNFYDNESNDNTLDLRKYKNFNENENNLKRFKTLDKKYIQNDISFDFQKNWKKNVNCALKYRFNKNKEFMDEIAKEIKYIDRKVKETFKEFHNETDDLFDDVLITKEKKKKKLFKKII